MVETLRTSEIGFVPLNSLKKGDYFKIGSTRSTVYVKDEFDRSSKKYACHKFEDCGDESFFSGSKLVYIDFEF